MKVETTMSKTNKKPQFNCDVNGGIMVTCALRYALGHDLCAGSSSRLD